MKANFVCEYEDTVIELPPDYETFPTIYLLFFFIQKHWLYFHNTEKAFVARS